MTDGELEKIKQQIPDILEERARFGNIGVYPGHKPYPQVLLLKDLLEFSHDSESFQETIREVEAYLDGLNDPLSREWEYAALQPIMEEVKKFPELQEKVLFMRAAYRKWIQLCKRRQFSKNEVGDFTRDLKAEWQQLEEEWQQQEFPSRGKKAQAIKNKPIFPLHDEPWENLTITFILINDNETKVEYKLKNGRCKVLSKEESGLIGSKGGKKIMMTLISHYEQENSPKPLFTLDSTGSRNRAGLRSLFCKINTLLRRITDKKDSAFRIVDKSTGAREILCSLKVKLIDNLPHNDALSPFHRSERGIQ